MPTVNVGSILTVDRGRYVGDAVNDKVTIIGVEPATVPGHTYAWTVTLQNAFTSTYRNGFVITRAFNVVTEQPGQDAYSSKYYLIVAVDATKKILTVVGDWEPNPPTPNFRASTGSDAPLLGNVTITTPSFPRFYQWFRDGVAIAKNADAAVYTVQNADAGKKLRVAELGSYWDGLSTPTQNLSAEVDVAPAQIDPLLVYSENIVYRGSFQFDGLRDSTPYPDYPYSLSRTFSIGSFNGQKTIYASDNSATLLAEYIIPPLVDLFATPNVSLLQKAVPARGQNTAPNRKFIDPTEGKRTTLGCQGNAGFLNFYGSLPISNSRLLLCGTNTYTYAGFGAMWTRPVDLLSAGQVSNPFVLTDTRNGYINNPRWYSGYVCNIPSDLVNGKNYQALLGGDLMSGVQRLSIDSNESRGPSAIVWNSSDIATTLSARSVSGTIVSSQSTANPLEHLLGLGSVVTVDPTGDYLSINGGGGRLQTVFIKSWNSATKVATVRRIDAGSVIFPSANITGITLGAQVVVTISGQNLYDSNNGARGIGVTIKNVVGTTQLNNNSYYYIKNGDTLALYSDPACTVPVDGSAFTAWVSGGTADVIPTTTSTFTIAPKINGFQVLGHTEYMQPVVTNAIGAVASGITGATGHFIPKGTRSLIYTGTGCDGEFTYSPGAFGFTGNGPLVYDTGMQSAGPHSFPYNSRVWCYDLDELVAVKNESRPTSGGFAAWDGAYNNPSQLKPYAVFTLTHPFPANSQFVTEGCCIDSETNRIYFSSINVNLGLPGIIIHAYDIVI